MRRARGSAGAGAGKIERYVEIKCPRCSKHPRFPRDGLVRALEAPGWNFCVSCALEFYATT